MDKGSVKLALSILSAEFARLEEQGRRAELAGRVQKDRALYSRIAWPQTLITFLRERSKYAYRNSHGSWRI